MKETYKRAHEKLRDILTLTEVFVNQRRMNVCELTVKMASHG
jgi:hypothetical protein